MHQPAQWHVQYGAHDGRHKQDEDQLECEEPVLKRAQLLTLICGEWIVLNDVVEKCWEVG